MRSRWLVVLLLTSLPSLGLGATGTPRPSARTLAALRRQVPQPYRVRSVRGDGPTVVFLHGYGGSPTNSILPDLVRVYRAEGKPIEVVAPWTEPKRGRLDRIDLPYRRLAPTTLSFELAQIQAIADATPGKLTLVGHSFGGLGARVFATLHPDKVERLVLLAPAEGIVPHLLDEVGAPRAAAGENRAALTRARTAARRKLAARRAAGDKRGIGEALDRINWITMALDVDGYDREAPLERLRVPTLVIRADADEVIDGARVDRLRQAAGAVRLVGVPGADHMFEGATRAATRAHMKWIADQVAAFVRLAPAR